MLCFLGPIQTIELVPQTRRWEMPLLGIYSWTRKIVDLLLRSNLGSMVNP